MTTCQCSNPNHNHGACSIEEITNDQRRQADSPIIAGMVRDAFDVDAFVAKVLARLASPHPCPSCGDLTSSSLCPACQEWERVTLEMEPRYVS